MNTKALHIMQMLEQLYDNQGMSKPEETLDKKIYTFFKECGLLDKKGEYNSTKTEEVIQYICPNSIDRKALHFWFKENSKKYFETINEIKDNPLMRNLSVMLGMGSYISGKYELLEKDMSREEIQQWFCNWINSNKDVSLSVYNIYRTASIDFRVAPVRVYDAIMSMSSEQFRHVQAGAGGTVDELGSDLALRRCGGMFYLQRIQYGYMESKTSSTPIRCFYASH